MNFTFTTHVGDGTTTVFSFSFAGQDTGYIAESNLAVFVDGLTTAFTVNRSDPNKVYLSTAPAAGKQVVIRRIMPKNVPYTDFKRGNAFTQDNLNRSFLQQLYVTQEMLDGYLPEGFYYKQDVNMGGYNIKNLGDAVDPDDAIKKEVTDGLSDRLTSLEGDMTSVNNRTVPWNMLAVGGESVVYPPYIFDSAILFINGVAQTFDKAYVITNNAIMLAEPLLAGDQLFALIGNNPAAPSDAITGYEASLISAAIAAGVPVANTYWATAGLSVTNALAFFDGVRVYKTAAPLTGTVTAVNLPNITVA